MIGILLTPPSFSPYDCHAYSLTTGRNSTKLATSVPLMVRVCENNTIFCASVRASDRPSISLSQYLLLNSTKAAASLPLTVKLCESNIIFRVSVHLYVRRPSTCPSRYLLLNHWAELNQTYYITSPHGKGVREQYFSVRPLSVHLSVMLSPPKPLDRIQPNLLNHCPSW